MEKQELFSLIKNGLNPQVSTEFSASDANSAAVNAMCEQFGITMESSTREIRACQNAAFALVEEAIDQILPAALEDVVGAYAEVKTFARDAEVIFKVKNLGQRRARLTITKGARGGIYRAARLDNGNFQVPTQVYTVGVYVTLEDIILGTYTLQELFNNILQGFEETIYKETIAALAQGQAAAGNTAIAGTAEDNAAAIATALDEVVPKVKQYGTPLILGFYSKISKIMNSNVAEFVVDADKNDIRAKGYVSLYKGTPVVEIPDYLEDETNAAFALAAYNKYIFVIPAGAKPVKVALKGELTIVPDVQPTGSEEWSAHKIMGVGVLMANNYGVITVGE